MIRPALAYCLAMIIARAMIIADLPAPVHRAAGQTSACREVTVAEIQGDGGASPLTETGGCYQVTGCITGVAGEGFFIQSQVADDDASTSEGVFVYRHPAWTNPRGLKVGDRVHLSDFEVQEFYQQTEIVRLAGDKKTAYQVLGSCTAPEPASIRMPADAALDPQMLYERFEGMRVTLNLNASVTGPTRRYASRFPAGEPEITVVDRNSPFYGKRISIEDIAADRATLALSGGLGVDLPDVSTLDRLTADTLTGILAFQFGRYVLLVENPAALRVEKTPEVVRTAQPVSPDEFAICTFNVENLFDHLDDGDGDAGDWTPRTAAAYTAELQRKAATVRKALRGCAVIGVQEIEGKEAVWEAFARAIGPRYRYDMFESQDERDITVGIVFDMDRVEVWRAASQQACTAQDYGVDYAVSQAPRATPNPCPAGQHPLFDRPPYVADLAIRNAAGDKTLDLRVIVTHLKSKRGDERENQPRRVLQAQQVASLMSAPYSIVVGDLNDVPGSAPLAQFAAQVNLYDRHVGRANRYSYIYQGRAEAIDHIILTSALDRLMLAGGPIHSNADFPETRTPDALGQHSSDHDPLIARFAFTPTGVSEAIIGAISGAAAGR